MTTLGALTTQVHTDLGRTDLTTEIEAAARAAIADYQTHRFYFNETRDSTFSTVASTSEYAGTEGSPIDLQDFYGFDAVWLEVSNIRRPPLVKIPYLDMEQILDSQASAGEPRNYMVFNRKLYLHPVPTDVWTIRLAGHYRLAAPATSGEVNNAWMTEVYELIRCATEKLLFLHRYKNADKANLMQGLESIHLNALARATEKRTQMGYLRSGSRL